MGSKSLNCIALLCIRGESNQVFYRPRKGFHCFLTLAGCFLGWGHHQPRGESDEPRLDLPLAQVGLDVGQLHHYRGDCDPAVYRDCKEQFLRHTVRDTSVRERNQMEKNLLFNEHQVNSIYIPIYKDRDFFLFCDQELRVTSYQVTRKIIKNNYPKVPL